MTTHNGYQFMNHSFLQKLVVDESGVIISAELALVLTVAVLAMVVGLSELAVAVNKELNDLSNAFGALSQSYGFTGFVKTKTAGANGALVNVAYVAGSAWTDAHDDCDNNRDCCDMVCGAPAVDTCG